MNETLQETTGDEVFQLENHLLDQDLEKGRASIREILLSKTGLEAASIGDALAELNRLPGKHRKEAILLLRCLSVQGLMPEPNSTNQIVRSIVTLCEDALPDIVSFLRIDKQRQNIDKFQELCNCHSHVEEILNFLRIPHGNLQALLSARKDILGGLNHSIVRQYASPFLLKETRATIETIYGQLKRVSEENPSLLTDVETCNQSIARAKAELSQSVTFLSRDFLAPFLNQCEKVVASFLETLRGRFATAITLSGPTELQKRYPLHEPERTIQIVVPMRNSGPGLATDIEISIVTSSEQIALQGGIITLGNVLPGDFSFVFDAMVISSSQSFSFMANVEWGEIGAPTRRGELFDVTVVAQDSTIDWPSLLYESPYTTGPAEGDQFFGRKETVGFLSAKLLRQPMESFYISGQKRVGKTSLALAVADYAAANSKQFELSYHYILWGNIAHSDPGS